METSTQPLLPFMPRRTEKRSGRGSARGGHRALPLCPRDGRKWPARAGLAQQAGPPVEPAGDTGFPEGSRNFQFRGPLLSCQLGTRKSPEPLECPRRGANEVRRFNGEWPTWSRHKARQGREEGGLSSRLGSVRSSTSVFVPCSIRGCQFRCPCGTQEISECGTRI